MMTLVVASLGSLTDGKDMATLQGMKSLIKSSYYALQIRVFS